jgi:hypothetical protein
MQCGEISEVRRYDGMSWTDGPLLDLQ